MRKEEKWKQECRERKQEGRGPFAQRIKEKTTRKRIAERKDQNAEYWLRAANNLLQSDTPDAAIVLGYFAMENKAEALLALRGYKLESHLCVIKGVSRVLEDKKLATELQNAYSKRKDVNYESELRNKDANRASDFIDNVVNPFLAKMEETRENINLDGR